MSANSKLANNLNYETVLILQGGGSLGAYECGVYKTLFNHNIEFDITVGTSIGAVNGSVITGTKDPEKRAIQLENFWYELAENITPEYWSDSLRTYFSTFNAAIWGNPNVVLPATAFPNPWLMAKMKPFLYDNTPLKNTLRRYVDFDFLNNNNRTRLVITSVDIQKGNPVIFDSKKEKIMLIMLFQVLAFHFMELNGLKKMIDVFGMEA